MIYVIATVETHPGKKREYLDYFLHTLVPLVRAERGCLEYGPTIDVENPLPNHPSPRENVVTIVERWSDLGALEAHRHTEHMHAYRAHVKSLVVKSSVVVLQPVTAADTIN